MNTQNQIDQHKNRFNEATQTRGVTNWAHLSHTANDITERSKSKSKRKKNQLMFKFRYLKKSEKKSLY